MSLTRVLLDRASVFGGHRVKRSDLRSAPPGLSPELRFVIECVRRGCGASPRPLPSPVDWDVVLRYASAQSVFGVVEAALKSDEVTVPPAIRDLVSTGAAMASLHRRHWQEPAIRRTLTLLKEGGCSPVVLKGVALAYTRYVEPQHRTFSDIDVLLPRHQLDRANSLLVDAGFTLAYEDQAPASFRPSPMLWFARPARAGWTVGTSDHHHLPALFAPRRMIVVELHRTLFEMGCPFVIDIEGMLARAQPITVLGIPVRELAPEDALFHVTAHLSWGHRFDRYPLRSLADVLALTLEGDVDWTAFVSRVRRAQASGAVYWPLWLARQWLGAPIPPAVLDALAPPALLRRAISGMLRTGVLFHRDRVPDDGRQVLSELLIDMSLYTGCALGYQLRVVLDALSPARETLTHLPEDVKESPARYALRMARARRFWRAASAFWRYSMFAERDGRLDAAKEAGAAVEIPTNRRDNLRGSATAPFEPASHHRHGPDDAGTPASSVG